MHMVNYSYQFPEITDFMQNEAGSVLTQTDPSFSHVLTAQYLEA